MDKVWTLERDLRNIIDSCDHELRNLSNANIFITGGTGFIGRWILESIQYSNSILKTSIQATILTRSIDKFKSNAPHLAHDEAFTFIEGEVSSFFSADEKYSHLIHAATDASAELNENNPLKMFDTVVLGTRNILEFAVKSKISRVLYLSSGAVYGQQVLGVDYVQESSTGAPNCIDPKNAYAEGKRASEMLCAIYGKQFGLQICIARIFALLGPLLNLNIHFAAGNFIRDAIAGKKITVLGDGRPERSYLYPSDLVVWLLAILTRGTPGVAYNVGSEEAISIANLAKLTSSILGNHGYEVLGLSDSGWNPGRYVPDANMICKDLGVEQKVNLTEAILRTASWNGWKEK